MKAKIQDIVRGKFEYEESHLVLPDENLEFTVIENETYEGSFQIRSSSGKPIRGIITCSNPNVTCQNTEFDAAKVKVCFTYQTRQMAEGETDEGQFVLTSSAGEYLFAFRAHITRHYLNTSIGKIKTLNDFSNLAKLNWEEALKVFQSPHFSNIFHEQSEMNQLLYQGLTAQRKTSHEMEEFLIGCGKKKRNRFRMEEEQRAMTVGTEIVTNEIAVEKSEWGYIDITISCDAPFVELTQNRIQMKDFVGKHAVILFHILPQKMHGGKNYAVITLKTCFQKQQAVLVVRQKPKELQEHPGIRKNRLRMKLEQEFLSVLSEKSSAQNWMEHSLPLLETAKKQNPSDTWNRLFAAYINLSCGRKEEAERELSGLPRNVRGQRTPVSAFYLYLTTIGEDAAYTREVASKVREIYQRYQNHPVLFWALLQIDETLLRNPERKYDMIRRFVLNASCSPVFYSEAAKLVRANPDLLHLQDHFGRRLIYWMARKNCLNTDLALRILDFAQTEKQFSPAFFRVLGRCHKIIGGNLAVKTICVYLIKNSRYGAVYFPWFRRGIEQHLKIAGLYEAYMLSWSRAEGELPLEVIKYFTRSSSLPARRKAILFAYVVRNRERLGKDWEAYMELVREFAREELQKGRMSDELAIIYEEVKRQMDAEEWEQWKKESENCYLLHTSGEHVSGIRVLQKDYDMHQRVPVYQENAYIYLYRKPFVILYEDSFGALYTARDSFRLRKMLAGEHIYSAMGDADVPEKAKKGRLRPQTLTERLERFEGSIEEMYGLICQGSERGLDVSRYWQELMVRMLFTGRFLKEHEEVFDIIRRDGKSVLLADAYVSWFSAGFLMYDSLLPDGVFDYVMESIERRHTLNGFCEAALLKAYARDPQEAYREMAEELLQKYLLSGSYFEFYRELPDWLRRKYVLMGIQVIQFRSGEGQDLFVRLGASGMERMREVLPGIYTVCVRMLETDTVGYEILDRAGNHLSSGRLLQTHGGEELDDTRYGRIGRLLARPPKEEEPYYEYAQMDDLTEILFLPIEE